MKKKITKKLTLGKEKIAALNREEMSKVVGASVFVLCSESCSVYVICCGPTTEKEKEFVEGKG